MHRLRAEVLDSTFVCIVAAKRLQKGPDQYSLFLALNALLRGQNTFTSTKPSQLAALRLTIISGVTVHLSRAVY